MPGKQWRVFSFVVEIAVESPKTVDEEEAAEDASEFVNVIAHTKGRVHESFCSVTRIDEFGRKRPPGAAVQIKGNTKPPLEDRIKKATKKPTKAKPKKVKAKRF